MRKDLKINTIATNVGQCFTFLHYALTVDVKEESNQRTVLEGELL